ncbi:Transposon Ty3-G Gag-Pol polyprotein [Trichinella sp. T6]|nr:Transposon Ty3-G Gag-Pol polyprotein [Trichinella sp. T6]
MAASTVHRLHAVGATELARFIPVARHCQTSSDPDLRSLWRDGRGVFRVDEDGLLRHRQASSDRADDHLLVPKELRNAVLAAMHNTTFGGHFASRRTLDRLQRRYFWPRMRKAVDAWCQACRTCVARNEPTRKSKAPLQMLEVSCAFQTLAMDFLGPLEGTVIQRLPLHFGRLRLLLKMDRDVSNALPSGHGSCRRIGWQLVCEIRRAHSPALRSKEEL